MTDSSKVPAYLLRIVLATSSPPAISRMLRVPMTTTFEKLHDAIQTAFDWNNAHAYEFDVHTVANRPKRRTFLDPSYVMNLKNHEYQDYETNMFPPVTPGMPEEERARMPREPEKKAVENTMLMDVL